jgi:multidrug resistance efflux pump
MQRLTDLRDQLGRIERLRLRLIDGQPVQAGDLMLLIDRARDAITGEIRQAKARLQRARAA